MTQKNYREILDYAAQERIPDDLNLLPGIAAGYEKHKGPNMKLQLKLTLAVVLALAVFAVILFTVPQAATAMRRVLGYVPGLGLVEQGEPLMVLSKPVMLEREGVRFTIEKGSTDSQRTILLISVNGLSQPDGSSGSPYLQLADGRALYTNESTGYGSDTGYTQRIIFPAIPEGITDVVLNVPCLIFAGNDQPHTDWQIALHFEKADPSQLVPVIELPTAPSAETPLPAETGSQAAAPSNAQAAQLGSEVPPFGITTNLDKVAEVEDGYILMGSMAWTDPALGDYAVNTGPNPTVLDADGNPVIYEYQPPDSSPTPGSKRSYWALKIPGKDHSWPLTIQFDAQVILALPEQPSFPLDLTNPPAEGQSKPLDIQVEAGGYPIQILSYTTETDPDGNGALRFTVKSEPNVIGIQMFDVNNPVQGGGGGGGGGGSGATSGSIQSMFSYDGPLPNGPIRVSVTMLMLNVNGDWTVTWQP